MRRMVIGSEVGANFTPGFGALHEVRRPRLRMRFTPVSTWAGGALLALLAVSTLGHLH